MKRRTRPHSTTPRFPKHCSRIATSHVERQIFASRFRLEKMICLFLSKSGLIVRGRTLHLQDYVSERGFIREKPELRNYVQCVFAFVKEVPDKRA